jgi:hypothetical protein
VLPPLLLLRVPFRRRNEFRENEICCSRLFSEGETMHLAKAITTHSSCNERRKLAQELVICSEANTTNVLYG